jgi:hypothetical protein
MTLTLEKKTEEDEIAPDHAQDRDQRIKRRNPEEDTQEVVRGHHGHIDIVDEAQAQVRDEGRHQAIRIENAQ